MGAVEVKVKCVVDLKMGSITRNKETAGNYTSVPVFVNTLYNLVTDVYEWGWGQSFHFSFSSPNLSYRDAVHIHEKHADDLINAHPGLKVLNVGCEVSGLMRAITARLRSNITRTTINEYQVARVCTHNQKAGLDLICDLVCDNFLSIPSVFSLSLSLTVLVLETIFNR
ncbi:24-methylenesterol C-methyltransferase 2-like [Dioscorea cayenensis subsp. rotundata]|uniref:24-methylenesterol C-methyltransferase 2-like n=1 Tax=Dioscorea cayennensis subsp. rotundata TaxID=55577 RepID=A0AB40D3F9_DIOCR|nr:24-methylenesterol C-methyltransferase 2-like [Dioscorea cayenensis subsp. rotundata]